MNIQPLFERILVRPQDESSTTASGLFLPESSKEASPRGTVVAVGDLGETKIKLGDIVLFGRFAGTKVEVNGVDHIILDLSDLLAVVSE